MLEQKKRSLHANIRKQMFSAPYRLTHDAPHWPPTLDTDAGRPEDAERRAALEREARLASERIDRALALERARKKKNKGTVKILLLGGYPVGLPSSEKHCYYDRAFAVPFSAPTLIHIADHWFA